MSDIADDDRLPSVNELLAASDWAGQVEAARVRRAAALVGREPRPALRETKPWEAAEYVALVEAPPNAAPVRAAPPVLTGTPVLRRPARRWRHPVVAMAAAGFVLGGLLSPVVAGRMSLWFADQSRRGAELADARPVARAAAVPVAQGARPAEAAALAGRGVADGPPIHSNAVTALALPPEGASPDLPEEPVAWSSPEAAPAGRPEASEEAVYRRADAPPLRPVRGESARGLYAPVADAEAALPAAVSVPARNVVAGLSATGIPPDALPAGEAAARLRIVVFLPDGADRGQAGEALAALSAAGFAAGEPGAVGYRVARTHVRVYHPADRERADAVAAAVGGEARDFTGFRPLPPAGTVEVWLAGVPRPAPAAVAQRAEPAVRAPGPRFITAILGNGRRERLRVIEDGGGTVTRAARPTAVWEDRGTPVTRDGRGDGGGRGGGAADPGPARDADRGGPSRDGGRQATDAGGGGAPERGAQDRGGGDAGQEKGNGNGRGGGNGNDRAGGNGGGRGNGDGNGNGNGNGGGNGRGGGNGGGHGNGGGNGKGGRD